MLHYIQRESLVCLTAVDHQGLCKSCREIDHLSFPFNDPVHLASLYSLGTDNIENTGSSTSPVVAFIYSLLWEHV
jgi:hypothetical protein